MIDRYSRAIMRNIWTEENKFKAYLEVEILAAEAWSTLGVVPAEDVKLLREKATFNVDRIHEIEEITRHDVVAFTRTVSESLGEEKKWVHYGLTSTDVVDTANGYLLKQANAILRKDLASFMEVLKRRANEFKYTPVIGRTHGMHADVTSFGLKWALWYEAMARNIERFEMAARGVEAGKLSGAVGNYANIPPAIQTYVCEHLGIESAKIATQVLGRDRHAFYLSTLACIAGTLEQMALEVRNMQRQEVREVEEAFRKGQKGSSAMPQKRNRGAFKRELQRQKRLLKLPRMTALFCGMIWKPKGLKSSDRLTELLTYTVRWTMTSEKSGLLILRLAKLSCLQPKNHSPEADAISSVIATGLFLSASIMNSMISFKRFTEYTDFCRQKKLSST